jgi:hypothetical protein
MTSIGAYNPAPLAPTPGSWLGVYDVTAVVGAGGMGQVFRACFAGNQV